LLTEPTIKALEPADKPHKAFDKKGLHLLTKPSGGRLWRFKYQFGGKVKLLSLGSYPDVGL